jgi:D-3-phosphoglycerate dehydrogenase
MPPQLPAVPAESVRQTDHPLSGRPMAKPVALYYSILNYEPANLTLLRRHFVVTEVADPRDDDRVSADAVELLFAPLGFRVDDRRLARFPKLRAVASNTTGIPHIDAAAAARRGVAVCALHDEQAFLETITPTAEHAIGLMIAALRRLPAAHAAAAAGAWSRWEWPAPRMLSRMRLGIVGYGRLGRKVARIAEAMEMQVGFYDPHVPGGAASLAELARCSDVLSLHAPATEATRHLVSAEIIRALPRHAVLVNTARGELLDEAALLAALEDGHLHAAALDTVDGEYEPGFTARFAESPLARYARSHDNLILTPHIGGSTRDAWEETQRRVIVKAMAVFGFEAP